MHDWLCHLATLKLSRLPIDKNHAINQNFTSFCIILEENLACGSQMGHTWIASGLLCGSVGQKCDPLLHAGIQTVPYSAKVWWGKTLMNEAYQKL